MRKVQRKLDFNVEENLAKRFSDSSETEAAALRYIAFDVETPNHRNNRMSAIGITVIEDGAITREFYSLVDPEQEFDPFNISLTGITPEMVEGQPTFGRLWETIAPMLTDPDGILLAHNAPFDMGVLGKCIEAYGIDAPLFLRYACTCQMSRQSAPNLPNHRLDTLCSVLRIDLDHHNAGSDSRACGLVFLQCLRWGVDPAAFTRTYDVYAHKTVKKNRK